MATEPTAPAVTFSSPAMRARVHLLAALRTVDDLERAWAARDYWTARGYAERARVSLVLAREAWDEVEGQTATLEAVEPAQGPDRPPESLACSEGRHGDCRLTARGCPCSHHQEPDYLQAGLVETESEARAAWGDR